MNAPLLRRLGLALAAPALAAVFALFVSSIVLTLAGSSWIDTYSEMIETASKLETMIDILNRATPLFIAGTAVAQTVPMVVQVTMNRRAVVARRSINQGATTMWERWDSYTKKDGFHPQGMNSFNHYAYGAIGQWMYERVAGLSVDPAHPGYKHFFVRPVVGGPLTSARAELETAYGTASSGWVLNGQTLTMDVVVPPNTAATIEFPNGRKSENAGPGKHSYTLELQAGE